MRTLPTGSVDPKFGRRVRNRRKLNSLQNRWPYCYSMPMAVRYTQDAFSRSGWLWPVDAKGEPLKATSYMAVGFYVAKYVNKKSDMDLAVFFQAEDGIRDLTVTGVQTCALPISEITHTPSCDLPSSEPDRGRCFLATETSNMRCGVEA